MMTISERRPIAHLTFEAISTSKAQARGSNRVNRANGGSGELLGGVVIFFITF
jgi:hypothetical protein